MLTGKTFITRKEFYGLVEEAYTQPENFRSYLQRHAPAELYAAVRFIRPLFQPDDKPRISQGLDERVSSLTSNTTGQAAAKYRNYEERGILAPLLTFHGAEFEAALLDEREEDSGFPAKRYSLLFLLRRGKFDELSEKDFFQRISLLSEKRSEGVKDIARERRFAKRIKQAANECLDVYGHFRLGSLLPKTRRVWFEIGREEIWGKKGDVTVISGLTMATDPPAPIRQLNRFLQRKKLVAWFIDTAPATIRFGRALPALFAVHELRVALPGGKVSQAKWSIAFNQSAFFLSSLYWKLDRKAEALIS